MLSIHLLDYNQTLSNPTIKQNCVLPLPYLYQKSSIEESHCSLVPSPWRIFCRFLPSLPYFRGFFKIYFDLFDFTSSSQSLSLLSSPSHPYTIFPIAPFFSEALPYAIPYGLTRSRHILSHWGPIRQIKLEEGDTVAEMRPPCSICCVLHGYQASHWLQMCRGVIPTPVCSLEGVQGSVSPHGPMLVDPVGILGPSDLRTSIPNISKEPPGSACCLVVGPCICLQLLLDETSEETAVLGSCLQV